jgi:hypothetical protein
MSAYWKGWPNKCPYSEDIEWASKIAIDYLVKLAPVYKKNGRVGIVVFDLDDTLFMGDPEEAIDLIAMSLGNHVDAKGLEQEVFIYPVNNPIKKIASVAKKLGFKVICLTARPNESKLASIANLNMFEVPHDYLLMNEGDADPYFKVHLRQKLATKPNQDVVCTVGDMYTDLLLPGPNTCIIKLPEPDLKCSYAYVPDIPDS